MILWTLSGYSDPEGELEAGEIVCDIAPAEDGFRLVISHNGEVLRHNSYPDLRTARGMAEVVREQLLNQGWEEAS
jgi:hypothetical protein